MLLTDETQANLKATRRSRVARTARTLSSPAVTLEKKDIPPAPDVESFGSMSVLKIIGVLLIAVLLCVLLVPWLIVTRIAKLTSNKTQPTDRLEKKYDATSKVYDITDWYWERMYRKMRPMILGDVGGKVLEVGVGTGNNLRFYDTSKLESLTAVDISQGMLEQARVKRGASCPELVVDFVHANATKLEGISSSAFDWYISTFLFCVLPDECQAASINEMVRVLRTGGRFRVVEMVYSRHWMHRIPQLLFQPWVTSLYGARFDRKTFELLQARKDLKITRAAFLKADTYLLIEGIKV